MDFYQNLIMLGRMAEDWDEALLEGAADDLGHGGLEMGLFEESMRQFLVLLPLLDVLDEDGLPKEVEGLSELGSSLVIGEVGVENVVHVAWIASDQGVHVCVPRGFA